MVDLDTFATLVPLDHGLVVLSTSRADGTIQSSVVNAGVLDHPVTGQPVVGLVAAGPRSDCPTSGRGPERRS